jgi:hypothetical protein
MNQMDLIDIYRVVHLATCGTFTKIDNILGHKASLNLYKKIEITP